MENGQKKLKVLHILPSLEKGGAEQMVVNMLQNCDRKEFDPELILLYDSADPGLKAAIKDAGIPVHHLHKKPGPDIKIFFELDKLINRLKPDIVHTHIGALRYAFPSLALRGVPVKVHTLHNIPREEVVRWARCISRMAFHCGVTPVATSRESMDEAKKQYKLDNVPLIYNGLNVQGHQGPLKSRSEWRKENGYDDQDLLFVNVARLAEQKNQAMLIEAFSEAAKYTEKARLLIIGSGKTEKLLSKRIKDQSLEGRVKLFGKRDDIRDILNASDIFVLSSNYEGTPLAVIEAMTAGLPIISTSVGTVPELVENGKEGFVIKVGDKENMINYMRIIASDRQMRERMGLSAKNTVRGKYNIQECIKAYEALYKRLSIDARPGPRRLLIISSAPHVIENGRIIGWGPLTREIDRLSGLFEEVTHVTTISKESGIRGFRPYESRNIKIVGVTPAGGNSITKKLGIFFYIPRWVPLILTELRKSDAVHIRCPSNIGFVASVLLSFMRHPKIRWIKYAGNWGPTTMEAWSFALQRKWIKLGLHRAIVTVNGEYPDQPAFVRPFYNPCITEKEIESIKPLAEKKELSQPVKLLFVGRLDSSKRPEKLIEIINDLKKNGVDANLDFIGGGKKEPSLKSYARQMDVLQETKFHGWMEREEINSLYLGSHFIILPTLTEGWPKVLSEAMACGCVPLASDVGSIGQNLKRIGSGKVFGVNNTDEYAKAIRSYLANKDIWKMESLSGIKAADIFTFEAYLREVKKILQGGAEAGSLQ